jgi:branched-chain amino acid transport system substrate-binding protein
MKHIGKLIAAVGLTVSLGAAVASTSIAATLELGVVLPLTGPAAEIGNQQLQAVELAVREANASNAIPGTKIELKIEDNQARPDLSIVAFNKLVDLNKVPLVVTGYSGPSLALAPLAARKKVVIVNAGAQSDLLATASPYLFNTIPSARDELMVLADYLVKTRGFKTAAIIYQNDAQGKPARDAFADLFTKNGGNITVDESVPFGETNFRGILTKIQAAKPDVIFVMMAQGFVQLAEQVDQLGIKIPITSNTSINQPSILASPLTKGWLHTQLRLNASDELLAEFRKINKAEMGFYARQYFNGTKIIIQAIKSVVDAG